MPRQASVAVENNFVKGLISEATGLNFPENSCTATNNCIFNQDGSVERRPGINFENGYTTKTINRANVVVSSFLWRNVAGDGSVTLYVVQVGNTLYFWNTSVASGAVSSGALSTTIDLTDFMAPGVVASQVEVLECQYCSGSKYMVVTHPLLVPFYVSYDPVTQTATGVGLTLRIRDFEGDPADNTGPNTRVRPTSDLASLNAAHRYNLYNQGWRDTELGLWDTARTDMPSNADVWWVYKVPTTSGSATLDAFNTAQIDNFEVGNSPAPKGHFIGTAWDINRNFLTQDLSGAEDITDLSAQGLTRTESGQQRPQTAAFFAGRVFYAGINTAGFNSNIYFTQIIERDDQYVKCYQDNDPTSETLHDLLPTDGGVIKIPEAGTIIKLFAMSSSLIAFCTNGVWAITGSTGLGFVANDYVVQKLSSIVALSASSFVDVGGYPAWWNTDGIFILGEPQPGSSAPSLKALTIGTIKSYYDTIPLTSKQKARGFFNTVDGIIQWVFRSAAAATPTETYAYDTILNFNTQTGAWYPWDVENVDTVAAISSVVALDGVEGQTTVNQVISEAADNVINDASDNVIVFSFTSSGLKTPTFKYLISYPEGGSYKFTFAEPKDTSYLDWSSLGEGKDYISFFLTGYKIRRQAIMKFAPLWVNIYSDTLVIPTSYQFRGVWDYALDVNTARWSSFATLTHTSADYAAATKRIKVRGHGKVLQFLVNSVTGVPFKIIGWSVFDTGNSLP